MSVDYVRLSININDTTQNEIRHVMERDRLSVTEAVRRLVGYGSAVDTAIVDEGSEVHVRCRHRPDFRLILTGGPES